MTNVAVKTHQMTDRKLSSLVTGGPPLWITKHRHSGPVKSQPPQRPHQNVILNVYIVFKAMQYFAYLKTILYCA